MPEFALLISDEFRETRNYATRPPNIEHKNVEWLPVVRDHGEDFTGRDGDNYVFRRPLPEPAKTTSVSARAARLALLNAGLLDAVNNAVQNADQQTKIAWEYATEIYRDDPLVMSISEALNLSQSEIDALFDAADKL